MFLLSEGIVGGYFSLSVHPQDSYKIYNELKKLKIKDLIPPKKYHLTLMYDKSNPSTIIFPKKVMYLGELGEVKILGDAIVIEVISSSINDYHEELKSKGFTHSYNEFNAHVSVKYEPTKTDEKIIVENLPKMLDEMNLRTVRFFKIRREVITED